jgi:ketosteroid isomerase-like protein
VLGNYSATAVATGVKFSAPFVHTWTLADGKIVRLQQVADTLIVQRALGWVKASDNENSKQAT